MRSFAVLFVLCAAMAGTTARPTATVQPGARLVRRTEFTSFDNEQLVQQAEEKWRKERDNAKVADKALWPRHTFREGEASGVREYTFPKENTVQEGLSETAIEQATHIKVKKMNSIAIGQSYVKGKTQKYFVLSPLGQGAFGAVYLAYAGKTYYAVKLDSDEKTKGEYDILQSLKGVDAVVTVVDEVSLETTRGFVMELANGGNLKQLISSKYPEGMPEDLVKKLALPLAKGLATLHDKGITIRDIKPSNILVFNKGNEPEKLKFADFGLAKQGEVASELVPPQYNTAPEVTLKLTTHKPADVFALGLVIYEMLLGSNYGVPRVVSKSEISPGDGRAVNFQDGAWARFKELHAGAAGFLEKVLAEKPTARPAAAELAKSVESLNAKSK